MDIAYKESDIDTHALAMKLYEVSPISFQIYSCILNGNYRGQINNSKALLRRRMFTLLYLLSFYQHFKLILKLDLINTKKEVCTFHISKQ